MDRARRLVNAVALLAVSAACSSASRDAGGKADGALADGRTVADEWVGSDGPAWLELGRGDATFEPLPSDSGVSLQVGPQGAWMALLALRGDGFVPEDAMLEFRALWAGGLVANLRQYADFVPHAGALETAGLALVFDPKAPITNMMGQEVVIDVALRDTSGATVQIQSRIRPK